MHAHYDCLTHQHEVGSPHSYLLVAAAFNEICQVVYKGAWHGYHWLPSCYVGWSSSVIVFILDSVRRDCMACNLCLIF